MIERTTSVTASAVSGLLAGVAWLAIVTAPGACNGSNNDCGLGTTGDSGGSEEPWIEVYNQGKALADGQTLGLILGGQGSCMFEVEPYVGGFEPDSEYSEIEVTIDLDGVAPGPGGHFYSQTHATFIGCEDPDAELGGSFNPYISTIQMLIDATDFVDGSEGRIAFTLVTPDGRTSSISADLTFSTNDCSGGYYP